jgi:hypothetical protein
MRETIRDPMQPSRFENKNSTDRCYPFPDPP